MTPERRASAEAKLKYYRDRLIQLTDRARQLVNARSDDNEAEWREKHKTRWEIKRVKRLVQTWEKTLGLPMTRWSYSPSTRLRRRFQVIVALDPQENNKTIIGMNMATWLRRGGFDPIEIHFAGKTIWENEILKSERLG